MGHGKENRIDGAVGGHSTHRKKNGWGPEVSKSTTGDAGLDGGRCSVGSWRMSKVEEGPTQDLDKEGLPTRVVEIISPAPVSVQGLLPPLLPTFGLGVVRISAP